MFERMYRIFLAFVVFLSMASTGWAQSWIQIESQPSSTLASERARAYAEDFPNVNAFRTGARWHAIVLGPFAAEGDARRRLLELRAARLIPRDSYVVNGSGFGAQVYGSGDTQAAAVVGVAAEPAPVLKPGEETPQEARRSERELSREEKENIQIALRYEGYYNSVIDASFGAGTRRAMSAWQSANGFEETGILTTLQRRDLVQAYQNVISSLGIASVSDAAAGIDIDLPMATVAFDRYDAPFAHYEAPGEPEKRVVLISLAGDSATLAAYFDLLQTLEIVPDEGERNLGRESFTITGQNKDIKSHTYMRLAGDAVKGFTLVWPVEEERKFGLVLDAMQTSFRTNEAILPSTERTGIQDINLMSGLEIRRPEKSGSGFFVDSSGAVLTTQSAISECRRVTIGDEIDTDLVASDRALGLALLRPASALAPLSIAQLTPTEPRIASDVAVSGYSFGGVLSSPTLTYGTLADIKGLDGDDRVQRLALSTEPGDAGGPVFDASGAVLGMLLGNAPGASRQLPDDVAFAVQAPVLAEFLGRNGITAPAKDRGAPLPPEDLTLLAADLTVLVSCWE